MTRPSDRAIAQAYLETVPAGYDDANPHNFPVMVRAHQIDAELDAHTCDFTDGLDSDCQACHPAPVYGTPPTDCIRRLVPRREDGMDWYEENGSIHVDLDRDPLRQFSLILKPDGKIGWAVYVSDIAKLWGPDAMSNDFTNAMRIIYSATTAPVSAQTPTIDGAWKGYIHMTHKGYYCRGTYSFNPVSGIAKCDECEDAVVLSRATAAPVVVGEDMVRRALDAQPFTDDNLGDRVWQLIGYDSDDAKKIIRAALTAALAGD